MTGREIRALSIASAAIAGVGCLLVNDNISPTKPGSFVTEAQAVIGRPLTPMSYAGVARRTTRRALRRLRRLRRRQWSPRPSLLGPRARRS